MAKQLQGRSFGTLVCVECAARSDKAAANWRAYISSDDEVVIFCPACARREFGVTTRTADDY